MVTAQEWQTDTSDLLTTLQSGGNEGAAQIFTLGTVGDNFTFNISSIQLSMYKFGAPTGNATFEIFLAHPNGEPIDGVTAISQNTSAFDVTQLTLAGKWYKIPMNPATLVKGGTYALVIKFSGGGGGNDMRLDGKSADVYAGGTFWESDGTTWTEEALEDLAFVINGGEYTGTMCTLAEVVDKAGANASTISTNEILANTFVLESESTICGYTKYNWLDDYSTLNEDIKFLLNETTSCMAAIKMMAYDPSGYTDNEEIELMIDTYREIIERNLNILENSDSQDWINNGATN